MADKINNLEEMLKRTVICTAKYSAFLYPGFVGIMTEINNTQYFDEFAHSLSFVAGIGVAHLGVNAVKYLMDNYKINKKDEPQIE